MRLTPRQIIQICDTYLEALAGGDILNTLRIHAESADVILKHVVFSGLERSVVSNVFKAANAQGKIERLLATIQEDGINLRISPNSNLGKNLLENLFPKLEISQHVSYLPTSLVINDPRFCLLRGRILNPKPIVQRVWLKASVTGSSDIVTVSLDVPPTYIEIPYLRVPRFTQKEAKQITRTITPGTLNVELYMPGSQYPVDSFQKEIWLSQRDIVLIARQADSGEIEDYSSTLAWWVNSGAEGLADFLVQVLPLDVRQTMGYLMSPKNSDRPYDYVDQQVRALYEGVQQHPFTFMPTELVLGAEKREIFQRVRTPEEIIRDSQKRANCLDGAILLASLIEYMGLDPILAIVPGHALLGWKREPVSIDTTDIEHIWRTCGFLDTTIMSSELGFDVAVSAAQGHFLTAKDWFANMSGSLREFARIIDVKAARGLPSLGVVTSTEV